ncbi:MAG: flagellin [Rhodospirillales bacterium]|nr:flagellin [Alphaproteobacteria bacterium]MCB9987122.1 flagellin [Rhodospirillales bacterium]USO08120.1 MAG: flagellin [Rhodospirillales bacterium]
MTGEVVLSSALRSNLLSLQRTQASIDKVQGVLSTGLKVSSALDNPQNFFASEALKNRSSDLTRLLDGIGQSIQTIKAADAGVSSLTTLVQQADSIVASAREAVNSGGKVAAATGDANLAGVTDLTSVTGIHASDQLDLVVKNADGKVLTLSSSSVSIASNDSIEQLITKINDITDSTGATSSTNGKQLLKAELDSSGNLKLTGLEGVTFNVTFNANSGTAGGSEDQALASALGFGQYAKVTPTGSTNNAVEFTATPNISLVSGVFYTGTTDTLASASTALTSVMTTNGGAIGRFDNGSGTDNATLNITINNKSVVPVTFNDTTTIQGLVDGINNNASLNQQIKASYDATTGKFSIAAISSDVQTVKIALTEASTGDGTAQANFGFGVDAGDTATDGFLSGAASGSEGETFILASAASTLSQYESDYNSLREQIDGLVKDSGYRGVNLIGGDNLDTYFNEDRSNKLTTSGSQLNSAGLGLDKADFSRSDTIEKAGTQVRAATTTLRSFGSTLANSLSIIQTREDFTKNLVATLNEGSDKLTLADQNEEGAKLLALQTRQQLGVTALSLASQSQQSVLRLF